jgi:hypothetical protein
MEEIKPRYSLKVAMQLIFDCMAELQFHTEKLSDEILASRLRDIIQQLDLIDSSFITEKKELLSRIEVLNKQLNSAYSAWGEDYYE